MNEGHDNANFYNANDSTGESDSQVDLQTLQKNLSGKVRSEMEKVVATVKTGLHEEILTAMEKLVVPSVELVMRSAGNFSACKPSSVVLGPDQKEFLGNINSLQMIASSRLNSNTNISGIDESRGNVAVEKSELSVVEKIATGKYTLITTRVHIFSRDSSPRPMLQENHKKYLQLQVWLLY